MAIMGKLDYKIFLITAFITMISVTLPGYLYFRGLPLSWTLALFVGFCAIAVLGVMLGRQLK